MEAGQVHGEVSHGAAQAAHEGVKEVANWITVLSSQWHGTPWVDFLHRWENVVFSWIIAGFMVLISWLALRNKSRVPGPLRNFVELVVESLAAFITDVLGERGKRYIPFLGTLFLYILLQNLMGIVPTMKASTSSLNTTIALAVCVFFYVQGIGIRENGFLGYLHHLAGSPQDVVGWVLSPLMFPLHVIGEFIKPLSLSLRLFGNVLGEDALIAAFVTLGIAAAAFIHIPVGLPLQFPLMLLACITGTIQALVFALLSTIYILLMLPHEEHEH